MASAGLGTASARRRPRLSAGPAFWTVAVGFVALMSFMTVPTPLYGLYERRDDFGAFTVTLVFAAYGVGVVVGLFLTGHVSDHVGRRPVVVAVALFEAACAVLFVLLPETAGLLPLRFATGVGVGAVSATVTAWLGELHAAWRPDADGLLGRTVATAGTLGGLALGPVVAALLSLSGDPLAAPYWWYAAALVVVALLVLAAPETVPAERRAEHWPYRPQRVGVDDDVRAPFVGAAVAALAGFAVLGFVTALTGQFLADVAAVTSRMVVGVVATAVLLGTALSQVVLARVARRRQLQTGAVLVVLGMFGLAVAALTASLAVFVGGGMLATGGVGLVFAASVATVAQLSQADRRSETLAALFLAAYAGITAPVVLVGAALLVLDVVPVMVGFSAVVALTVPLGIRVLLRETD